MFLSVFGGLVWTVKKRCENANVDVNTFMRFQTEVFENALVWTGPKCVRDEEHDDNN